MKVVLQTGSLSWAHSVRLSLVSAGIDAELLDEAARGPVGFGGLFRVAVVNDGDVDRAAAVIAGLAPPTGTTKSPAFRWLQRTFRWLFASFALGWLAQAVAEASRVLAGALFVTALGCLVAAIRSVVMVRRAEHGGAVSPN